MKINPSMWEAHHAMSARLQHASGKKRRRAARTHATTAVSLQPTRADAYYTLAGAILRTSVRFAAGEFSAQNATGIRSSVRADATEALLYVTPSTPRRVASLHRAAPCRIGALR